MFYFKRSIEVHIWYCFLKVYKELECMLKVSEIYTSVDTVCIGKGYYQYNNRVLIQQKGVTLI